MSHGDRPHRRRDHHHRRASGHWFRRIPQLHHHNRRWSRSTMQPSSKITIKWSPKGYISPSSRCNIEAVFLHEHIGNNGRTASTSNELSADRNRELVSDLTDRSQVDKSDLDDQTTSKSRRRRHHVWSSDTPEDIGHLFGRGPWRWINLVYSHRL